MKVDTGYCTYEVSSAEIGHYSYGGGLAIELMCIDEEYGFEEPLARLTVNLQDYKNLKDNQAFIDTNNCPWAEEFLKENKFAKPTGIMGHSGYCVYPLYEFDLEELNAVFGD